MIRALTRLLPYVVRVRRSVAVGFGCIILATAFSLSAPWVLKYVVDGLLQGVDRARLAVYAAAVLGLSIADGYFRYLMRIRLIGASRQIEYDLRNDFFAHLERLPPSWFETHRTGDLMSRATNDLGAVRMMIGPAFMYFASTTLGFALALGLMLWIDARLTLLALLPLPGVTLGTRYFGRAIHDRFERIQSQLSDMSAVVQEALAGVRVVRAYGQEGAERRRFERANDEYVERNRGLIRLQSAFYPSLTLCFGLSGLVVLWVGGRDVMTGRLTLGEFVAFSRYLVLLSWPLIAFGWVVNLVQRGTASWERMLEVLDADGAPDLPSDRAPDLSPAARQQTRQPAGGQGRGAQTHGAPVDGARDLQVRGTPTTGRIEARHLTFRYPGTRTPALEDVSATVEPGQMLAIVGATGSGKSTFISLLPRLREPPRDSIFIDGTDICDIPVADLRAAIAVVPQEPYLFSASIEENVLFGVRAGADAASSSARLAEIGRLAALDQDVARFPDRYQTIVGERGITLSGGQKQRVALARALISDSRILVLDDALSAVDTATEDQILRGLRTVRRSRTVIIVAHRISTVREADLIVVLEGGRVAERGTHETLVAAGGVYAAMHERQMLEEELSRA
jgi:ATP-binding cassette subfamily B protein